MLIQFNMNQHLYNTHLSSHQASSRFQPEMPSTSSLPGELGILEDTKINVNVLQQKAFSATVTVTHTLTHHTPFSFGHSLPLPSITVNIPLICRFTLLSILFIPLYSLAHHNVNYSHLYPHTRPFVSLSQGLCSSHLCVPSI